MLVELKGTKGTKFQNRCTSIRALRLNPHSVTVNPSQRYGFRRYDNDDTLQTGVLHMARFRRCACGCGALIDSDSMRKFSSPKCRQKAYRDRNKSKHIPRPFRECRVCAYCGQAYEAVHPLQRSCKPAHRQALYRELKALKESAE